MLTALRARGSPARPMPGGRNPVVTQGKGPIGSGRGCSWLDPCSETGFPDPVPPAFLHPLSLIGFATYSALLLLAFPARFSFSIPLPREACCRLGRAAGGRTDTSILSAELSPGPRACIPDPSRGSMRCFQGGLGLTICPRK